METLNIQIGDFEKAVNLCLENAGQYIKDAELLIENSSFGHAHALGVLAYEELGKAKMLSIVVLYSYFSGKKDIPIPKKMWKNRRKNPFFAHPKKQKFEKIADELFLAMYQYFNRKFGINGLESGKLCEDDVKEFFDSILPIIMFMKNTGLNQLFFRSLKRFVDGELEDLLKEINFDKILNDFSLEDKKWAGLYVDLNWKDGKFATPKKIREDDASKCLEYIKGSFRRMEEFSTVLLELGRYELIREEFVKGIKVISQDKR